MECLRVQLKLKLLHSRDRMLSEGDVLTWRGCLHRKRYAKTIEDALSRLIAGEV